MKAILAALLSLFCTCSTSAFIQPQHSGLTQKAEVACWKSGNDFTLTFYLDIASDTVERVYTVKDLDPTDVSIGTFDDQNGINGSGTTLDPFTFSITGSGTPINLDAINQNTKKGYVTSPDVISVNVMAKAIYADPFFHHILFKNDVLYIASCNFTELEDKAVKIGQLFVSGEVSESPYLIADSAELQVLSGGVPTTSVILGEEISLLVSPNTPTHSTGVYVHSCAICDRMDCSGLAMQFIDVNGCGVGSYISNFVGTGARSQTTTFKAFVLNNQGYVHFQCMVNFCYEDNDLRCDNYCDYNNQVGRKRRQATPAPTPEAEDTQVTAVIRITVEGEELVSVNGHESAVQDLNSPSAGQQVAPQTNMALLASVITLAVLLVGLILAMIIFYRMSSKSSLSQNNA